MQKVFIKYTVFVMTAAILLIFFINSLVSLHTLEAQQFQTFQTKMEQVIHTLENNQAELDILKENLDEDYLTRARAAEYVFDRQKEVSRDVEEMQYLAKLLNVDELHIIDENGYIASSSVSKYVGIDMADHEQTRAFLEILESGDEDAYLIQDMQPNAAENKMMKYVGVSRKGRKGVVQVGFKPTRQMEAQSRNTYEYIFSRFPTDVGEELYVVDCLNGEVLGHSGGVKSEFLADCYQLEQLLHCTKGEYKMGEHGRRMYVAAERYQDMLICAALPSDVILQELLKNVFTTLVYLLLIEAVAVLLLNHLVKRKVVDGIHQIIENLNTITNGNLDVTVSVGGNQELEKLSRGINAMVKSIVSISDRTSAIIELSGIPLAAFEYEKQIDHLFVTSGLGELLDIPGRQAEQLYKSPSQFERYIRRIAEQPVKGEEDVYQINDSKYVCIHMSRSFCGYLGVITDVTKDILEKKRMQYENTHDPLTGLYKYSHFKQLAADILRKMPSGKLCAVVMIDLDCFKSVNDTYGHDAGDKYLQGFSAVLQEMPKEHFLTARRSGDEFCMMLFDCQQKSEVIEFLDLFYESLSGRPVVLTESEERTIGASSGFVCTARADADISELLGRADEALYYVKKGTRGRYAEYREQ